MQKTAGASFSRRRFVQTSLCLTLAGPWSVSATQKEIGLYLPLSSHEPEETVRKVRELGFTYAEFYNEDFRPVTAKRLEAAMKQEGIFASGLMMLGPGETVWDFYDGPQSIGLVPRQFRRQRIDAMKRASDFCLLCGIPAIETHVGFIPENPNDPLYEETVVALREVVEHCQANGHMFLYHAGQETPTTLMRTLNDVGLDNQGVGLDTANLIMYDKGHPTFALEIYGSHLKAVNAKDGLYPTNTRKLGKEVRIGEGKVDFPTLIAALGKMDFSGPIIIEREISGLEWEQNVKTSKRFLQKLVNSNF